jgi:cysteinyl-tRNA synthetase
MSAPRSASVLRPDIAQAVRSARSLARPAVPPADIRALVDRREQARRANDWAEADVLRRRIADKGWRLEDTPAGTRVLAQDPPS